LISFPYSYILNYDFFYKHWFFSGKPNLTESRFQPIPDKWVEIKHFDKMGQYELRLHFPYSYSLGKGMNFAAVRFDIDTSRNISLGCRLNGSKWTEPYNIDDKTKTATAFFPVTAADLLTVYLTFKEETKVSNVRYAFLPYKEFLLYSQAYKKIKTKQIFGQLRTLRKLKSSDELYNLETDLQMTQNLLLQKKHPKKVTVEGKRKIYQLLDYYLGKMKKIIGISNQEKDLTEEEKKMLKSLGYL
jgi:hypothetical protein